MDVSSSWRGPVAVDRAVEPEEVRPMKLEGKIVLAVALILATPLVVTMCAHPADAGRSAPTAPPPPAAPGD
jgi:hypothetical protein